MSMNRSNNRADDWIRPASFELNFVKVAEGSVLAKFGDTHVLCNVTVDETLPSWLRNQPKMHGWLTAEYALLPRSTQQRVRREQRWPKGRTQEISRLIGRSLRMAVDLNVLGLRQLIVDCDVIQADGGTRTTAISGGWLAVKLALEPLIAAGELPANVIRNQVAAISVGIVDGRPLLDLDYREDFAAEVDLNVVMTSSGDIVEIQGAAEKAPFSRDRLEELVDLAALGCRQVISAQNEALATD
ncbi:MAG: ribonuclease PH [Chloroflexota bacterium]